MIDLTYLIKIPIQIANFRPSRDLASNMHFIRMVMKSGEDKTFCWQHTARTSQGKREQAKRVDSGSQKALLR